MCSLFSTHHHRTTRHNSHPHPPLDLTGSFKAWSQGGCGLSQLMPHQRTPYDIFLGLGARGHGTHSPPPLPTNLTRKPCTSLKSRVIVSVICVAFFSSHALFIPSPFTLYPLSLRLTLSVLPPSLFNTHFLPLPTSPFITHFLLFDHSIHLHYSISKLHLFIFKYLASICIILLVNCCLSLISNFNRWIFVRPILTVGYL